MGESIYVEFRTTDVEGCMQADCSTAAFVAKFYLATIKYREPAGRPVPPEYHILSAEASHDNPASVDLIVSNGGSKIDPEKIRAWIQEHYLDAPVRSMLPNLLIAGSPIPKIERQVVVGYIN